MTSVAEYLPEIVRNGDDFVDYVIRPYSWNLLRVEQHTPRFMKVGIFSDDIPKDTFGFLRYVLSSGTLWFEIAKKESGEHIGFIYLSDLLPSWTEKRYISAYCHALVWNARVGALHSLGRDFIKMAFSWLRLHKLCMSIPAKFGGAIRHARQLGFVDEGRIRKARRYNGVWFDVIHLSILEDEVALWATPLVQA